MTASGPQLTIGVLGPLAVEVEGAAVDLGKGRERAVLGVLVLHRGQVVPVDRLIDLVWGERPPPTAAHALQVHVSNLRKRMGGADAIATERPGYTLRLPAESVDATRFEQAARAGREALRDGDPAGAAATLAAALDLWRGPALADLAAEPWAEHEAARLEGLRLQVTEDRHEAELVAGRHADVLGSLEAFARANPLRERAWGQLMLALYRSGRQAEALRAGDTLRATLRDELGLDPSAEIRGLERDILAQDPALALPAPPAPVPPAAAPGPGPPPAAPPPGAAEPVRLARDEQRTVTALFADLADSTPLGEAVDAEEFKVIVDDAMTTMVAAVGRYGGTVVNVGGDGLLALFGAPVAHEDDAERAVRAGLDIVAAIRAYGTEVAEAWGVTPLAARVGIHTGPVVLGPLAGGAVELTAMGDTVNTASRLEGAAASGAVVVGASTRRQLDPLFEFADLPDLALKGKRAPVPAAVAVRARPVRGKVRGLAGVDVDLVGRRRELATGREAVDAVLAGTGGVLLVTGDAGVGKSRLLAELRRDFETADTGDRERRWLGGRSPSYGERLPYWPFRELLRDWLGLTGTEPEVRVRVRLRSRLDGLLGAEAGEVLPFLAGLLGAGHDPDVVAPTAALSATQVQEATFAAVAVVLGALAAEGPVVVALDDLHWADGDSLALLDALLPLTEQAAVLLVTAQRLDREHPSGQVHDRALRRFGHRCTEIALGPLASGEDAELLAALMAGEDLPSALAGELLGAAEGNPFFLEELVRSLLLDGDARREVAVPETVDKLIQSRIDALPLAARNMLGAAAVLGRRFELELLAAVVDDVAGLTPAVRELERHDLVREARRWPVHELWFKHALIQDTAYRGVVPSRRRALHRRAADHLAGLAERGDAAAPAPGLVAHHFAQAGDTGRALHYHGLAAAEARASFAQQAAMAEYDAALDLVDEATDPCPPAVVAALALGRGELRRRLGLEPGAAVDLHRAVDAARAAGDTALEVAALTELGLTDLTSRTSDAVLERLGDGLVVAERTGDTAGQAALLARMAIEWVRKLQLDRAHDDAELAVARARDSGDPLAIARALDGRKLVALSLGDLAGFAAAIDELEAILRARDDKLFLLFAVTEHGQVAAAVGDGDAADALFAEALELSEVTGARTDRPLLLCTLAASERARGRLGQARRHEEEAGRVAHEIGHQLWIAWVAVSEAATRLELGDPAGALAALAAAPLVDGSAPEDQQLRAEAFAALAHHELGDDGAAAARLARYHDLRSRVRCPAGTEFVHAFDADVAAARAAGVDGDRLAATAAAAERSGWHEAVAATALAQADLGGPDARAGHLERAVAAAGAAGLSGLAWRALASLAGTRRAAGDGAGADAAEARARDIVATAAATLGDGAEAAAHRRWTEAEIRRRSRPPAAAPEAPSSP